MQLAVMSSPSVMCCTLLVISIVCYGVQIQAQQESPLPTTRAELTPQTSLPEQTVGPSTVHLQASPSPQPPMPTGTPKEEEEEGEEDFPHLIFAKRVAIHRTNLNGTEFETIIGNVSFMTNAVAIDFDARQQIMFWTDVDEKVIVKCHLNGSNATILVDSELAFPDGIAWDWLNEKLYWSDSEHREIEVLDPESGDRMQLVETDTGTIPRDVAVDPNTRWLYWTDWGTVAKIERISMDGDNSTRQVLHSTNLAWPNALTIDYDTQTLYWVDAQLNKIERSKVDGSNRLLLTTNSILHPFGLTYHDGYLYWSDWQTDQITRTPVSSPDNVTVIVSALDTEPMGLEVVATSRQPITSSNPCSTSNGNCSHLCLLSSSNPLGYSCECPKGMILDESGIDCIEDQPPTQFPEGGGSCLTAGYSDCCISGDCLGSPAVCFCDEYCYKTDSCCSDIATTCPKPTTPTSPPSTTPTLPFLLFANRQNINQMQLDGSKFKQLINTTINAVALDYNLREGYIYWSDVSAKTINRARMENGSGSKVLINTNLGIPDGLAHDWVTNKLYWTDATAMTVSVYDLDNDLRMTMFNLNSNSTPRAIVVDPTTRWLYWTDWGRPAKIERASMDGTRRQTIVDSDLIWPNALTIDRSRQILYWGDASLDKIESSDVDGSNRRVLLQEGVLHPFSIAVFNDTLYWSDWEVDKVFSSKLIAMRPTNVTSLVQGLTTEPMVVHVISEDIQINITNPCEVSNGNCSHLCLLSAGEGNYSCACPNGYAFDEGSTQLCTKIPPPIPTPTTPPPPGSCRAAGYTTCCKDDLCEGEPPSCFCDIYCEDFEDCCDDYHDICPPDDGVTTLNTTTILPPSPSPSPSPPFPSLSLSPSSPAVVIVKPSPSENSVLSSSKERTSSLTRIRTRSQSEPPTREPKSTPQPPPIVHTEEEQPELVSVGVVAGSLVASIITIVLIGVMVVLVIILIIIRQRTAFSRYQSFGENGSKEMTMINHKIKNQLAHEAKA